MSKKSKKIPGPKILDAALLRLEAAEGSLMNARHGSSSWKDCHIVLCRPLNEPAGLGLLEDKSGTELAMLQPLENLNAASQKVLQNSLRLRGLTARILSIDSLAHQYGAVYWSVKTDRGAREFVLRGLTEHVRWLGDKRIIITDVDGNRFEISDMSALDKPSRDLLDLVL